MGGGFHVVVDLNNEAKLRPPTPWMKKTTSLLLSNKLIINIKTVC
jgi:hypothetical protein